MKIKIFLIMLLIVPYIYSDSNYIVPPIVPSSHYTWDGNVNKIYVNLNDKTVNSFLVQFCKVNGCTLVIDNSGGFLNKTLNGSFTFKNNSALLNFVADKYGFSWFYYNNVLHIASNSFQTEVLSVSPDYLNNLKQNLTSMGLLNPRFGWVENTANSVIIVTGPESYLKIIKNFISKFTPLPLGNNFAVIKLKYANAADKIIRFNGEGLNGGDLDVDSIIIPGIARIINYLTNPYIMEEYQGVFANNTQSTTLLKNMLSNYKSDPGINYVLDQGGNSENNHVNNQQIMSTYPIVQADVRNNAIVIFDKNANLPMYHKLVELLDVAQPMIQLNTTIIDVDMDKINTDGVNWLAGILGVNIGFNGAAATPVSNGLSVTSTSSTDQLLVSNNKIGNVIANLNYLSQTGVAQINATPSVVTLMELPAITSFGSQVIAQQTPNQQNISKAGMGLSSVVITPHRVSNNEVRLEISLRSSQTEDGTNANSVGFIQTQAVVRPGDGLLLGGYITNKKIQETTQVPFLGSIPLLGALFRSTIQKSVNFKRVYLITVNMVESAQPVNMNTLNNKIIESSIKQAESIPVGG